MSSRTARIALTLVLVAIYSTLGVVRTITNFLRDRGLLRVSVVVAFLIAGGLVLWLILRQTRNRSWRTAFGLLLAGAVYAMVIFPMQSPEEKIHFIEYGVVAVLATILAAPPQWTRGRRFVASALFVAVAGWVDEGIQALLPSRVYDLRDVAFNAAAGLLALGALAIFFPHERTVGTHRSEAVAGDSVH